MKIIATEENDVLLNDIKRMIGVMTSGFELKDSYKIILDDCIKYLFVTDNCYFLANVEDNTLSSIDSFATDDTGRIGLLLVHNSPMILKGNEVYTYDNKYIPDEFDEDDEYDDLLAAYEYYQDDNEYSILKCISLLSIKPTSTKYASYNALLRYTETNLKTKVRLHSNCFYNAKFDGHDQIHEGFFKVPFNVKLVSLMHGLSVVDDREYYLTEWDRDSKFYDIALIKTIGFFRYFFFNYKSSFEFYYNKPILDSEGNVRLYNLLTSGMFDLGDIDKKINMRGLSREVPKELIDLFNGDNEDYKFCQEIVNQLKKDEMRLVKK